MRANGFTSLACPLRSVYNRYGAFQASRKTYSTAFTPLQPDRVQVKVGSNGLIDLDIYHPPLSPKTNTPVIIYLPRGPSSPSNVPEPASLLPLATAANTTVVQLNYRLSKDHRYPGPIHDVLAGYDWVVQHLAGGTSATPEAVFDQTGKIAVCGELIGGSLAAMLGLTECPVDTTGVRALFMGNPIADWTSMYNVPKPDPTKILDYGLTKTGRKRKPPKLPSWEAYAHSIDLSASTLLRARNNFFHAPEDYFDTFASPMLFFRTPVISVPTSIDALDEMFLPPEIVVQMQPAKKRKAHRRHPPSDMELRLPHSKIMVGKQNLLKDQGIELAEGIARSIHSYGGSMDSGEGTGWERVEVEILPGLGMWNEDTLVEIGSSLREILRD